MTAPLSPEAFYDSARGFATTALQAHHTRDYRRVTVDAGTALEHLAKACLAKRSAALLCDLRGEPSFVDLLRLLDLSGTGALRPLRTVGLRGALERVKVFVTSRASGDDVRTLADMPDGTIHAAISEEVETRLLVAFAKYADELLADLGRDRAGFWGDQLAVVDALLTKASDKITRDVKVKLAGARAYFDQHYGNGPPELVELVRRMAEPDRDDDNRQAVSCLACESVGLATGTREVELEADEWEGDQPVSVSETVYFQPSAFECRVCKLRLNSAAETAAASIDRWEVEDMDPLKYEPPIDEDSFYEAYRDR